MDSITLQTSDSGLTSDEILGRIGFAASSESSGGDAIKIAALIKAVAESEFTSTSNHTSLVLATATDDTATDKLKITASGHLIPFASGQYNLGSSSYPFGSVYSDSFIKVGGTSSQYLMADGSVSTVSAGGLTCVSGDLCGNLNLNNYDIVGTGDINVDGNITSSSFIKSGGTSSQFLKADGSVDGSTYAKSAGSAYHVAWFQGAGGGNDITNYGSDTKDNIYVSTDMYFQSKYGMRFLTDAPAFIGNGTERLHLDTSEAVFNDGGNNYDFRVEGDTDSDLLFVDANLDIVQIGKLNINGAFTFPTVDGSSGQSLVTDGAGNVSWSGVSGGGTDTNDYVDSISFNTSDGVLTLGRTGALSDLTVDLDGRYSTTDNDTTYTDGIGLSLVGTTFHANVDSVTQSVAPNSVSSTASRTYAVQVDSNDKLVVNVPWVDTNNYVSSGSFNTTDGVLTLNRDGLSDVTIDLDGRYQETLTNPATGTGTTNYVARWISSSTLSTGIIYDNGTNVGIGTATPQAKLDVNGTVEFDDLVRWEYPDKSLDTSTSTLGYMRLYDEAGAYAGLGVSTSNFNIGTSGAINLRFVVNAEDRMLFSTAGNNTLYYNAGQGLDLVKSTDSTDGLHFGDKAYSTSSAYQGIKHLGMTGSSDYMMISEGLHTLISAKATTGSVWIRGGGNYGANQIKVYPSTMPNGASIEIDGTNTSEIVVNQLGNNVDFRVEGDSDPNLLFADASSDRAGIGTNAPNGKLGVYHTLTKNTTGPSYEYGIHNSANHYTTGNGTNYSWGQTTDIRKRVASGITDTGYVMGTDLIAVLADEGSLSSSFGLRTYAGINSESDNGTLTAAYGIQSRVINYGQGTANINTARGIDVYIQGDLSSPGNGKITNAYGVYVQTPLNVTTFAYGLYVAAMDSGTTNRYGIYQNGANDINVLMGNVGIGTNTPSAKLDIVGDLEVSETITASGCPVVISNTGIATGSDVINNIVSLTEAEYFASTIDEQTLYVVTDASSSTDISTVDGRLTLQSGTSVPSSNQTAKTTIYFTPHKGNQIAVYDGTSWSKKSFSEISLSLSGYAADTNFDIFIYDNSGTLTLESTAWTNNTTRATALTTQNGVYVKSGATTRRYLGTIRTTATTGQCEDSTIRRFVWNYYNREIRIMSGYLDEGGGSHTYSGGSWRAYNNSTSVTTSNGGTRVELVIGINSPIHFHVNAQNKYGFTGISYDTTTSITTNAVIHDGTNTGSGMRSTASDIYNLSAGFHYLQVVENSVSTNTATFYWLQHRSYLRG